MHRFARNYKRRVKKEEDYNPKTLPLEKLVQLLDVSRLSYYMKEVANFLVHPKQDLCFPLVTQDMDAFLVRMIRDEQNLRDLLQYLDKSCRPAAEQILERLKKNEDVFKLVHSYNYTKKDKNTLVYKKVFSSKTNSDSSITDQFHRICPPKPSTMEEATVADSPPDIKKDALYDVKPKWLLATMNFFRDKDLTSMELSEMTIQQAELLASCIQMPKLEIQRLKPFWEALKECKTTHDIKTSYIYFDQQVKLLMEKIPLNGTSPVILRGPKTNMSKTNEEDIIAAGLVEAEKIYAKQHNVAEKQIGGVNNAERHPEVNVDPQAMVASEAVNEEASNLASEGKPHSGCLTGPVGVPEDYENAIEAESSLDVNLPLSLDVDNARNRSKLMFSPCGRLCNQRSCPFYCPPVGADGEAGAGGREINIITANLNRTSASPSQKHRGRRSAKTAPASPNYSKGVAEKIPDFQRIPDLPVGSNTVNVASRDNTLKKPETELTKTEKSFLKKKQLVDNIKSDFYMPVLTSIFKSLKTPDEGSIMFYNATDDQGTFLQCVCSMAKSKKPHFLFDGEGRMLMRKIHEELASQEIELKVEMKKDYGSMYKTVTIKKHPKAGQRKHVDKGKNAQDSPPPYNLVEPLNYSPRASSMEQNTQRPTASSKVAQPSATNAKPLAAEAKTTNTAKPVEKPKNTVKTMETSNGMDNKIFTKAEAITRTIEKTRVAIAKVIDEAKSLNDTKTLEKLVKAIEQVKLTENDTEIKPTSPVIDRTNVKTYVKVITKSASENLNDVPNIAVSVKAAEKPTDKFDAGTSTPAAKATASVTPTVASTTPTMASTTPTVASTNDVASQTAASMTTIVLTPTMKVASALSAAAAKASSPSLSITKTIESKAAKAMLNKEIAAKIPTEQSDGRPLPARKLKLLEAMSVPMESDKAMRMMRQMGWDGGPLGTRGEGITEPIIPDLHIEQKKEEPATGSGLGHVKPKLPVPSAKSKNFRLDILKNIHVLLIEEPLKRTVLYPKQINKKERGFLLNAVRAFSRRATFHLNDEEMQAGAKLIMEEMLCEPRLQISAILHEDQRSITLSKNEVQRTVQVPPPKPPAPEEVITIISAYGRGNYIHSSTAIGVGLALAPGQSAKSAAGLGHRAVVLARTRDLLLGARHCLLLRFEYTMTLRQIHYAKEMITSINLRSKISHGPHENYLVNEILRVIGDLHLTIEFGSVNRTLTIHKKYPKRSKELIDFAQNNNNNNTIGAVNNNDQRALTIEVDKANDDKEQGKNKSTKRDDTKNDKDASNAKCDKINDSKKDVIVTSSHSDETDNDDRKMKGDKSAKDIVKVDGDSSLDSIIEEGNTDVEKSIDNVEKDGVVIKSETEYNSSKRNRCDSDESIRNSKKTKQQIPKYLCIAPDSYPIEEVNFDIIKAFQNLICDKLEKNEEKPFIECVGLKNGALIYGCYNEYGRLLVESVASELDLKTTNITNLYKDRKRYKVNGRINSYLDINLKKLFEDLEKYNEGLRTDFWTVNDVQKNVDSIEIYLEIDGGSFDYISHNAFGLFAGMDRVRFSILWN